MKKIFYVIALLGILIGISACKTEHTHKIVNYEAKEPTCTEEGHKAYEKCSECDYTTYEKVDSLGHNLLYYNLIESTCTGTGKKEHWYCPDCGKYFIDAEGKQEIAYEDLTIGKIEHLDENNDYLCDYDCGEVLLSQEALQKIIENTLSSTKVTVNEMHTPSNTFISYYFDNNLLYINVNEGETEKYYYTEEDITYLLTKEYVWDVEITEKINYVISYLLEGKYNLEIVSDIEGSICESGPLEGKAIFHYNNSLGTKVGVSLDEDKTSIGGMYIYDENGNYIYTYEFIYGENEEVINGLDEAKSSLYTYEYIEATNTYLVSSSQGIIDAILSAETTGVEENPAIIRLLNDIEVEVVQDVFDRAMFGVLINSGVINIDLNGYQLSATNDPFSVIQIGDEWGETCDAVVTIEDNSVNQTGKILASYIGVQNNGGILIFDSGTIEVNNQKGESVAVGICGYLGSITMNSGIINVSSISEYYLSSGINEDGPGGTFTMNGGYINVNAPFAEALHLKGTAYINGGIIESSMRHISGAKSETKVYLGINEEGIGVTFVGGINSFFTLNSLLSEGVGYYDINGNLIEVSDNATEILDKGDIIVKKIN